MNWPASPSHPLRKRTAPRRRAAKPAAAKAALRTRYRDRRSYQIGGARISEERGEHQVPVCGLLVIRSDAAIRGRFASPEPHGDTPGWLGSRTRLALVEALRALETEPTEDVRGVDPRRDLSTDRRYALLRIVERRRRVDPRIGGAVRCRLAEAETSSATLIRACPRRPTRA